MNKRIVFEKNASKQLVDWNKENQFVYQKIIFLIKDIQNIPFDGLGKPEPLRYEKQGYWSRRINKEHRLVYKITD